jgi:hypothetical protein
MPAKKPKVPAMAKGRLRPIPIPTKERRIKYPLSTISRSAESRYPESKGTMHSRLIDKLSGKLSGILLHRWLSLTKHDLKFESRLQSHATNEPIAKQFATFTDKMKSKLKVRATDRITFFAGKEGYYAVVNTSKETSLLNSSVFLITSKEAIKALDYFNKEIVP